MKRRIFVGVAALSLMVAASGSYGLQPAAGDSATGDSATGDGASDDGTSDDSIVWKIDNLKQIGGHEVQVVGNPRVVDVAGGKAVEFDGLDDAIFLNVHPLAGARQFTVEVVFRPDADGPAEQRFFHMQEDQSDNRVLFETRLTNDRQWFLDTFIMSGVGNHALFAERFKHPVGPWYHAAIVVDDKEMRHYVDGKQEMAMKLDYQPQSMGKTSLGVRINKVYWFKGAIRTARFTRRVLKPNEFISTGLARKP